MYGSASMHYHSKIPSRSRPYHTIPSHTTSRHTIPNRGRHQAGAAGSEKKTACCWFSKSTHHQWHCCAITTFYNSCESEDLRGELSLSLNMTIALCGDFKSHLFLWLFRSKCFVAFFPSQEFCICQFRFVWNSASICIDSVGRFNWLQRFTTIFNVSPKIYFSKSINHANTPVPVQRYLAHQKFNQI